MEANLEESFRKDKQQLYPSQQHRGYFGHATGIIEHAERSQEKNSTRRRTQSSSRQEKSVDKAAEQDWLGIARQQQGTGYRQRQRGKAALKKGASAGSSDEQVQAPEAAEAATAEQLPVPMSRQRRIQSNQERNRKNPNYTQVSRLRLGSVGRRFQENQGNSSHQSNLLYEKKQRRLPQNNIIGRPPSPVQDIIPRPNYLPDDMRLFKTKGNWMPLSIGDAWQGALRNDFPEILANSVSVRQGLRFNRIAVGEKFVQLVCTMQHDWLLLTNYICLECPKHDYQDQVIYTQQCRISNEVLNSMHKFRCSCSIHSGKSTRQLQELLLRSLISLCVKQHLASFQGRMVSNSSTCQPSLCLTNHHLRVCMLWLIWHCSVLALSRTTSDGVIQPLMRNLMAISCWSGSCHIWIKGTFGSLAISAPKSRAVSWTMSQLWATLSRFASADKWTVPVPNWIWNLPLSLAISALIAFTSTACRLRNPYSVTSTPIRSCIV